MGTFVFKWPHAAEEVYVTGTFDNWSKTEKLEKVGDIFEKNVTLADASQKIYYKFVVDGVWTTDHTAPQEKDHEGNENNLLKPEDIVKAEPFVNSAAPTSTTAALAGEVPLEKETPGGDLPGAFPITPAADLNKQVGVNPLPAADAAINPIELAPGEKIPEDLKAEGVNNHVALDKESYENSSALPGIETLPPVTGSMIPESSLPIVGGAPNDVTINSVAPESTTAKLAGEVPLEPRVPEVVKESQEKAGVDPEASGIAAEVEEKKEVESELLSKVHEAPSTSEGTAGKGTEKSETDKTITETVIAGATAAGVAALATAVATKDAAVEKAGPAVTQATEAAKSAAAQLPESVKQVLPVSAQEAIAAPATEAKIEEVAPDVPAEVKASIIEANTEPEAAANTEAVEEKKTVEAELLKEVKPTEPVEPSAQPVEPSAEPAKAEEPVANGNGAEAAAAPATPAKPSEPAAASSSKAPAPASPATTEKKKKNRLSLLFSKLKPKKDKPAA